METRELGRSGIAVSRVVLGCGNFGGIGSAPRFFGRGTSREEAFRLLDAAWELGVTALDTADAYGGGRSESFIGEWLRTRDASVRDRVVVATKTYNPMAEGADRGLSRARIHRQLRSSLQRLGLQRVPLYLTHEWDAEVPVEETLGALDELVRDGAVGAIGCSNVTAEQLAEAVELSELEGIARFEWVQNDFSLLRLGDAETVFPVCREHGLGYTPFSPLAGGWLTGKYRRGEPAPAGSRMTLRPEPYERYRRGEVFDALEALAREAAERGVSTAGLALAWALAVPEVSAVVVGPSRAEHLDAVREALALRLTAGERDHLLPLPVSLLVLSDADVRALLDMPSCIEAMEAALAALARDELHMPLRFIFRPPATTRLMGFMPAHRGGDRPLFTLKEIVVAPDNSTRGLDPHQGGVLVHDGETGELRALLNASAVTEIRTAAVSAVATRLLARPGARVVAILGSGVQGRSHVEAMRAVLPGAELRIWSRTPARAEALAAEAGAATVASVEEALAGADVVCTTTAAREPIVRREWLTPGAHVNAVGASGPSARELDAATVAAAALFVDRRESTLNEAGDYLHAVREAGIGPEHIRAELGELLVGAAAGRRDDAELTVFESLGLAVEDLAAAELCLARAAERGSGTEVRF